MAAGEIRGPSPAADRPADSLSPCHLVTLSPCHRRGGRRLVEAVCFFLCALLLFRAVEAEPYGVPTGSMAPALAGNHKAVTCPRCGCPFLVGVREDLSA